MTKFFLGGEWSILDVVLIREKEFEKDTGARRTDRNEEKRNIYLSLILI